MAELGAIERGKIKYKATRIDDRETTYGIAVVPVDEKRAYLIDRIEYNSFVDGAPLLCYYQTVDPATICSVAESEVDR